MLNNEQRIIKNNNRCIELDYLRVFATFAVMILHIAGSNWYTTDVNGIEWQTFNFYDSIVRWSVPVFVMISGVLFLNREINIRVLYSKYIFRMITAFIAWSFFYAIKIYLGGNGIASAIVSFVEGHYHMWFVFMIIGIYVCVPFVKEIVKSERLVKYYLILSFSFAFLIPQIMMLISDFTPEFVIKVAGVVNSDVSNMNMSFVMGYIFYFILGYYIYSIDLNKKHRMYIYFIGMLGFSMTVLLDLIVALKTQKYCSNYYGNFTINVLFESLAVFVFFKYHVFKNERINGFVIKLSKYSFGAYLVHACIIEMLPKFGINSLMCNPIIAVPVMGLIVFIISFSISYIIHKIPILNKYIV